jgi:hypothetical protein
MYYSANCGRVFGFETRLALIEQRLHKVDRRDGIGFELRLAKLRS